MGIRTVGLLVEQKESWPNHNNCPLSAWRWDLGAGNTKYIILSSLVALLLIPFISNAAGPSFPSEMTEIHSPSSHYAVTWKHGGISEEKPHQLFLKNLSTGRVSKILEFHRQVNVLWAPDARFVAVTDWTGSNVSQVLLFQPGKKKILNLADCLHHSLGAQPDISKSVHVYFEAISWKGPRKLLFKVFGDAQDSGVSGLRAFEHYFEFDISGVVRKCRRHETGNRVFHYASRTNQMVVSVHLC